MGIRKWSAYVIIDNLSSEGLVKLEDILTKESDRFICEYFDEDGGGMKEKQNDNGRYIPIDLEDRKYIYNLLAKIENEKSR